MDTLIVDVPIESEKFRNLYSPIFSSKISNNFLNQNNMKIIACKAINNIRLENKVCYQIKFFKIIFIANIFQEFQILINDEKNW